MDNKEEIRLTGSLRRAFPKVGRNQPCICGSMKKYKACCYENVNDCYVIVKEGKVYGVNGAPKG